MSLDATSTDSEKFKSQHEVYSNPKFDIDPSFLVVPGWMLFGSRGGEILIGAKSSK